MGRTGRAQRACRALAALAPFALFGVTTLVAQPVIDNSERLDGHRAEAWGMQFAATMTSFGPIDSVRTLAPRSLELGFEAGSIPSLSEEQRRLGFNGTKVEEIDRGPLFGRLRARFGLARGFDLSLGLVPPVDVDGLEPLFVSASVGHALWTGHHLRLGAWLAATRGRLEGDITCSRATVAAGDDPAVNPLGCSAISADRLDLEVGAIGIGLARAASTSGGFEPYAAAVLHRVDGRFAVRAEYAGLTDRTVLTLEEWMWSFAVGAGTGLSDRWRLSGELDYTPLDLRRAGGALQEQPIWNGRLLLTWQLR